MMPRSKSVMVAGVVWGNCPAMINVCTYGAGQQATRAAGHPVIVPEARKIAPWQFSRKAQQTVPHHG